MVQHSGTPGSRTRGTAGGEEEVRLSLRTLPFSTGKGQETEEETLKGNGNENGNGDKRTE